MFLYVEGQLIQYFCFECTQSKYIFRVLQYACKESQRWRLYLCKQYVDNILDKMLTGLKNVDKIGLNPRAYPSRVQPQKCTHLILAPTSVYSKWEKEKESK